MDKVLRDIPSSNVGVLISELAQAAHYLETVGIVHRDIKPANVYMTEDLDSLKLLDLGVIRVSSLHDGAGTEKNFLGTARYSPPEFLYRRERDTTNAWRAISFYQLGATLHDLIMQRPIFLDCGEPPAVLYEAVSFSTPVIDRDDHEPWLVSLARRCLIKDWSSRLASVCWEDFEGPRSLRSASEIREGITRRYRSGLARTSYIPRREKHRPTRRSLERLSRNIASLVRDICQAGKVFPPIHIEPGVSGGKCMMVLGCGPSESHSLLGILQLRIVVYYTDDVASIVRLVVSSRLCDNVLDTDAEWRDGGTVLVVGVLDDPDIREAVDGYVHGALDLALAAHVEPGRPIMLHPPAGQERDSL